MVKNSGIYVDSEMNEEYNMRPYGDEKSAKDKCVFNSYEEELLLELISNEQIHMIVKDPSRYESNKYQKLEALKVKIKDM